MHQNGLMQGTVSDGGVDVSTASAGSPKTRARNPLGQDPPAFPQREDCMPQNYVEIDGARENNLKDVSVRIPKRKIVIFTGVSGSGKSSLIFDTVAAESQRQLNETFTNFVRNRLPKFGQPDADRIANLSTAIVIDQKRLGGNARSTVGTITDIYSLLRLLFSRAAKPWVGYSNAFSFNDPAGMCPQCEGIGKTITLDLDKFIDRSKSLNGGALRHPAFAVGAWYWKLYANSGQFDNDKKLADYTDAEWQNLLYGSEGKIALPSQAGPVHSKYEGLVDKFHRLYIKKGPDEMTDSGRETFLRFVSLSECPLCRGARLNKAALSAELLGYNIAQMAALQVSDLLHIVGQVNESAVRPVVNSLTDRLQHLVDIGLGYLSLDRETPSLSGGESQRIKMVRHLSSSLIEVMYIFDEPSVGLHARDVERLTALLRQLRDKGNSVFVVEHDPDVIESADHVIDMGPKAGAFGGQVVYQGSVEGLKKSRTLTGEYLQRSLPLKTRPRTPTGQMPIRDATMHNLKDVSVNIPVGVLTVVTGVAGSGKSTLINDVFLSQHPKAVAITQSALSTSSRSNPATYTGIMDDIRQLFARANRVSASLFSFNSKGACPNCQGHGIIYTDLAFLEPMRSLCEVCRGRRFRDEVLSYTLRNRSISDVLDMTMGDAYEFFTEKKIRHVLQSIIDVGLDYLALGQPLSTLSGGECQRVKLAGELHKSGAIYVMDEPTTGLHMSDVGHLLGLLDRLVDNGSSVIVIEHNLDVIKNADWIIDMGPEGGHDGGEILFEGTPQGILSCKRSLTGQYLARRL
jgi:excinuclease UvrABC ATPase subunit